MSLWDSLTDLIEQRHGLIHRSEIYVEFDDESLGRSIVDLQVVVDRVYRRLCQVESWPKPHKRVYRRPQMQFQNEVPEKAG